MRIGNPRVTPDSFWSFLIFPRYKNYWVDGSAQIVHPNYPDWHSKGTVLKDGPQGSVIEVKRLEGEDFQRRKKLKLTGWNWLGSG